MKFSRAISNVNWQELLRFLWKRMIAVDIAGLRDLVFVAVTALVILYIISVVSAWVACIAGILFNVFAFLALYVGVPCMLLIGILHLTGYGDRL